MANDDGLVHLNSKVRGNPVTLVCGAVRQKALVTGDLAKVTCPKCNGQDEPAEEKAE